MHRASWVCREQKVRESGTLPSAVSSAERGRSRNSLLLRRSAGAYASDAGDSERRSGETSAA